MLRPGGYWIHLGPLLWHWADAPASELSIELPLAELHRLARLMGFRALRQEFVDAAYMGGGRLCACVWGGCLRVHVWVRVWVCYGQDVDVGVAVRVGECACACACVCVSVFVQG